MSEQNKATARRLFEEILSAGRLDIVEDVFDDDYHDHDPANEVDTRGHHGVRTEISGYRAAIPDLTVTVEAQVAERDTVATRWTTRGTHRGPLMGIEPTGNQISITGITIHRFSGAKIREGWWNWDALGMLQQLGVALPE